MSPTMFFGLAFVCLVGFVWYQFYSLKGKVICCYRRPSKQRIVKLVSLKARKVRFDNLEFTILPDRSGPQWYNGGILQFIGLGTWLPAYDFSWYSKYPHDPNNYKATVLDPEVARVINNQDRMASLARGVDRQASKKPQGMMTWLMIGGALILVGLVAYLFMQNQANAAHMAALENAIRTLK